MGDPKNPPLTFIVAFVAACLLLCFVLDQYYPTHPSRPGAQEAAYRQLHDIPPSVR